MKSCPKCNRTYPDDTLAFCLEDGAVLSAPYNSEQTLRIPAPRPTAPAATEVLTDKARAPQPSTIYAPSPNVPPLRGPNIQRDVSDSPKTNLLPWVLISGAILIVGIFAAWMIISRLPASLISSPNQPTPQPSSSVAPKAETMCGQIVSTAILAKWTEMGGANGKLGCPINAQTDAPVSSFGSSGRWIQFAKGDGGYLIEYTRPQGEGSAIKPLPLAGRVFEVTGGMFKVYASLGGTKSWLGFPLTDWRE